MNSGWNLLRWCAETGIDLTEPCELIRGFADQCTQQQLGVRRLNLTLRTLHPLVMVENYIWKQFQTELEVNYFARRSVQSEGYTASPIRPLIENELARIRLPIEPGKKHQYPILDEYSQRGMTEYLAFRVSKSGLPIIVSLMTDQPGGFTETQVNDLEMGLLGIRPLLELHVQRTISRNVSTTYIGPHTGPRVLNGEITRGSIESLKAVIWFCDLRGFTPLTHSLGSQAIVDLLNIFFETVGAAVDDAGGEILKFIGDAALAVFPARNENDEPMACQAALKAASAALSALQAVNTQRESQGLPTFGAGIGLHIGEVSYGNVGAPGRLDFTVIGHAVNLASRIESSCSALGEPLVASAAFAAHCPDEMRSLGVHRLKGIAEPQELYGLVLAESAP